jgi:GrpB-like predicted nucleotidyltransferase (UPF0157 family)
MSIVTVQNYDPEWPLTFESLYLSISGALSDILVSVEHVGSTAVRGLAAKPVIDIDVVVAETDVAVGISRLATLGYVHLGDLGIPQREAFAQPPGSPRHNLYLCPTGSQALANHIAVRDYLRGNDAAAHEYGELKKQLTTTFRTDIDGYVEAKTSFLLGVLSELGFPRDQLKEIVRMNRKPQ